MATKSPPKSPPPRRSKKKARDVPSKTTDDDKSLPQIRAEAEHCRDCPLWKNATQTVFGEGPQSARVMLVGEQPGDQEDIAGKPFVGPAGRLLDRALQDAGVNRKRVYVTNAVKHFKFEPRGKRRLHKTPSQLELLACQQWLEREVNALRPKLIVAMGATAARIVFGRAMPVQKNRGKIIPADEDPAGRNADLLVTVHPSYLLRMPDEDKEHAYRQFVKDLKLIVRYLPKRNAGD